MTFICDGLDHKMHGEEVGIVIVMMLKLCSRCLQSAENADPHFHLDYRGPISMKGKKDPMKVWFLSRKITETEFNTANA